MSETNPEDTQPRKKSFFNFKKIIYGIIFILIIGLLITGSYIVFNQAKTFYHGLIANNKHWQHIGEENQSSIEKLQASLLSLQQNVQQSHDLLQQQIQKINALEGNKQDRTDTGRALEANYLVRLANDHLQLMHDIPISISLLKQAVSSLQQSQDLSLKRLQESIQADISRLAVLPAINLQALYAQLITLNQQIDHLPLRQLQTIQPTTVSQSHSALPWWKAGFNEFLVMIKKIVIIHYQSNNQSPLLLPQEKAIFYQNLHAQLQNVIWAVMYKQPLIYHESLSRLINWIEQYFDSTIPATQTFLSHLQELKKQSLQLPSENLTTTIQQFDTYFAQQT